jgi:hypothetical protein
MGALVVELNVSFDALLIESSRTAVHPDPTFPYRPVRPKPVDFDGRV